MDVEALRAAVVAEALSWAIYALVDPRSGGIRYVGYTSQEPQKRLREHLYLARKENDKRSRLPVYRWIRDVIRSGLSPEIRILETGTGDWKEAECRNIRMTWEGGAELTNVADGGLGPLIVPPESRYRAGLKLRNRYFSPKHRGKISEGKRGKPRPDAAAIARWMAEQNRGRKMALSLEERGRRAASMRTLNAKGSWMNRVSAERIEAFRELTRQKVKSIWAARSHEERARIAATGWQRRPRVSKEEKRAKKTAAQRIRRASARIMSEIGSCQI